MLKIILVGAAIFVSFLLGTSVQRESDKQTQNDEVVRVQNSDAVSCKSDLDKTIADCNSNCNNRVKKAVSNYQSSHAYDGIYAPGECFQQPGFGGMTICP